ncbi:MAG: hydrogenase expression/formation protein HypE, partial [Humidesulfovibrio sp.]|nr:hydrogenase expression/formation protein HypE [Humidesulfovibrio sp.]
MSEKVLLDYGSGGKASQRFIGELFLKNFDNPELRRLNDGAVLSV